MKKLNEKGLTLVELIIAITMSTIVVAAATVFLYNAERSYRISQYSIDLQMEAQLLMEQMSNWILESNHIEIMPSGEVLILYQIPQEETKYVYSSTLAEPSVATVSGQRIIIYPKNGKLYINVETESRTTLINELKAMSSAPPSFTCLMDSTIPDPADCIGEHVKTFKAELSSDGDNSVKIELGMIEGISKQAQSYSVSNKFSLRNAVYRLESEASTATP